MGPPTPALSEHTRSDSSDFPWSFSSFLQEASNKERKGMLFPAGALTLLYRGTEPALAPSQLGARLPRKTLPRRCEEETAQSIHRDLGQTCLKGRPCSQDQTTKEETRMPSSRDGDAYTARSGASLRNPRLERMLCSSMLPPT